MQAGDTLTLTIFREDSAGLPVSGSVLADFSAVLNGSALALSNLVEIGGGWYSVDMDLPETPGWILIIVSPSSGTDSVTNGIVSGDLEAHDVTSTVAALYDARGTVASSSLEDKELGLVVWGDSWRPDTPTGQLTLSEAALSRYGIDLTSGGWTMTAVFKRSPGESPIPCPIATVDDAANRLVTIGWDAMPAGFTEPTSTAAVSYYLDIQLTDGTTVATVYRGELRLVWARD